MRPLPPAALTERFSACSFGHSKSMHSRHDTQIVPSPSVSSHMTVSRERTEVERSTVQTRIRSFTDDLGLTWLVSERPFSEYDRRSGSSLIFSSELAVRRVRDYPSDWFALSDSDLAALSWRV